MKKYSLQGILAAVLVFGSTVFAGQFDLKIDNLSDYERPWPLIGGLPFPEGMLSDPDQIRLLRNGVEVPVQIDVAATWRDGSIRWALAGFTDIPQGQYQVEFGSGVKRSMPTEVLQIGDDGQGGLRIHTGGAVYEFRADDLMPHRGAINGTVFFQNSGDGAYLVDQQGRTARVAGRNAEVTSELINRGPLRAVVHRRGWYVTEAGERVARAKVWFYFSAGSPFVKITHSLVFTEDTNELWLRDYGLEFRPTAAPGRVLFALDTADRDPGTLLALNPVAAGELVETEPNGDEIYLLQDRYPHFLEREARAVVGRVSPGVGSFDGSFWQHDWLTEGLAVGGWGDATYGDYGVTLAMPWMAQRFPKEISFGPESFRAVFWSGRSGRELDFRPVTLVNEYWQSWANRSTDGADGLAAATTNAQGAARTHDVWLMPRVAGEETALIQSRAETAAQPPLVLADPAWLAATGAIGWPMHPYDAENFPEEEAVLAEFWGELMDRHEGLRRTGFLGWGGPPYIRGAGGFFRVAGLVDYGLRRHVWGLYARSGDRSYFDYATQFNRYAGDLAIAHHTFGNKFEGGFTHSRDHWNRPFEWGEFTQLQPVGGNTGHDIVQWLLEYYLTGDEYARDLVRMHAQAYRQHWEQTAQRRASYDGIYMVLRTMANLYAAEQDEEIAEMAHDLARYVIDMERPNAISDEIRFGSLYKVDRNLISLFYYYNETGDELAKQAFLQGIDHKYRFNRVGPAFSGQSYPSILFAIAYDWTGNPDYLRVVNALLDQHRRWPGRAVITAQINPTLGVPAALKVMAENGGAELAPFPLLRRYQGHLPSTIVFRKPSNESLEMRLHVRMSGEVDENAETTAFFAPLGDGREASARVPLDLEVETMMATERSSRTDLRRRYVVLTIPADQPAGLYRLDFPDVSYVDVLNSDAPEISVFAPEGFQLQGHWAMDYFRVPEGLDTVRIFLGVPTEIRRADGSIALEASGDLIGDQEIAVKGQAGAWSLNSNDPGVVRLYNIEPLFARSPELLVTDAGLEPTPVFEPPSRETAFVPGIVGQALHLPEGSRMRFPRGEEVGERYAHFPAQQGTVEFWFRPNWSSTDLPFSGGRSTDNLHFLRAGSHVLQYRYGRDRAGQAASLNLWAHGKETNAGFTGMFWFEAGEWYHLAFTWQTFDGEPGTDGHYAVFVNGEPLEADRARPGGTDGTAQDWPGRVSGSLPFYRRAADETIGIGPFNGTIAQLRISDVVRYEEPFTPPKSFAELDAHTVIYFPLDGNRSGVTPAGAEIELVE